MKTSERFAVSTIEMCNVFGYIVSVIINVIPVFDNRVFLLLTTKDTNKAGIKRRILMD